MALSSLFRLLVQLVALSALCTCHLQAYGLASNTYRAATVSSFPPSPPNPNPSPQDIILATMAQFETFVANASASGVNIIVFSEGASGWLMANGTRDGVLAFCDQIPAIENGVPIVVPCDNASLSSASVIKQLSCFAREYKIVIVANLCDYAPCSQQTDPNCPSDGRYQYNTDAAFAEDGALLAKYHKSHLFGESFWFDQPPPIPVYFDTSFGVRFGLLVCYDIEFVYPAQDLMAWGVRDLAYSSAWVNLPPTLVSVQLQQGWSRIHNANMIAANLGFYPWKGGLGIYSQGRALNYFFTVELGIQNKMLIADVPILTDNSTHVEPEMKTEADVAPGMELEMSKYEELDGQEVDCELFQNEYPSDSFPLWGRCSVFDSALTSSGSLTVTNGTITCQMSFQIDPSSVPLGGERWALMAHEGVISFPYTPTAIRSSSCQLLRCEMSDPYNPSRCSPLWQSYTRFTSISMSGSPLDNSTALVFPLLSVGMAELADPSYLIQTDAGTIHTSPNFATLGKPLWAMSLYSVTNVTTV